MATQSSVNLAIVNLTNGFSIAGGASPEKLTLTGVGDATFSPQQTIVLTLPDRSVDTVVGYGDYTAKGVILVGTGSGTFAQLSVGSDNNVLTADASQTSGVRWGSPIGDVNWNLITDETLPTSMSSFNGYFSDDPANSGSFVLPVSSAMGDIIEIVNLQNSQNFTINQGSGQYIQFGNYSTTPGVTGSITSTLVGDSLRMVCSDDNVGWVVISCMGNLSFV